MSVQKGERLRSIVEHFIESIIPECRLAIFFDDKGSVGDDEGDEVASQADRRATRLAPHRPLPADFEVVAYTRSISELCFSLTSTKADEDIDHPRSIYPSASLLYSFTVVVSDGLPAETRCLTLEMTFPLRR